MTRLLHFPKTPITIGVQSWGGTDDTQEREIVDLVIAFGPAVITAAATIIAAMITRPAKVTSASEGVLGIKLKRADGAELTVTYRGIPQGEAASIIDAFMRGNRN